MGAGLTIKELADLLDPPVTPEQIVHLICYMGLKPCGRRRSGRRGRPAALYDARTVLAAHAVLVPYTHQALTGLR
jgi:hypothetical protein